MLTRRTTCAILIGSLVHAAPASVTITELDAAWHGASWAWAINNHGMSVGGSGVGSSTTGYLLPATARVWHRAASGTWILPYDLHHSFAFGINDNNQVVGEYATEEKQFRPFIWERGEYTFLEGEGRAWAINDAGIIVGESGPYADAVMWIDGKMFELGGHGGEQSRAVSINNAGTIAGTAAISGLARAFRWSNGVATPLGTLGGNESFAFSINDNDQIVGGAMRVSGHFEAYIHENGRMIGIGSLEYESSTLWANNNNGDAIGFVWDKYDPFHPVLYKNGRMIMIQDLLPMNSGWTFLEPYDINNLLQIVGYGHFNGLSRGFLMTIHPGDVVGDTAVNIEDLLAVITAWGDCPPSPVECPADVHPLGGDGIVNIADLLEVIGNWG